PARGAHDARQPTGPVEALPAAQADGPALDPAQHAIAVELHLVEPAVTAGGRRHEGGQLWLDERRQRGAPRAGQGRRVYVPGRSRGRGTTDAGRLRGLVRPPHAMALPGDVIEPASGRDARGKRLGDVVLTGASCDLVPPLDQQPRLVGVPALPAADLHEVPAAVQLAAVKGELEPPLR